MLALLDHAGVREEFVRYLAQRLVEQQRLITHFVTDDSEHRLAAVLLYLARKIGQQEGEWLVIDARITQEEFAAMVGTTRSRVGLFLNRFHDIQAVQRLPGGTFRVHEQRLEAYIASDELPGIRKAVRPVPLALARSSRAGPSPSRHLSRTRQLHILAVWTKRDIKVGKMVAEYAKLLRRPSPGHVTGAALARQVAARSQSDQTDKVSSLSGPVRAQAGTFVSSRNLGRVAWRENSGVVTVAE